MTRYLASLGHRRIAFIKGHPSHDPVENGDNSFGSGEAAGDRLMKPKDPPTAIVAASDDVAAG